MGLGTRSLQVVKDVFVPVPPKVFTNDSSITISDKATGSPVANDIDKGSRIILEVDDTDDQGSIISTPFERGHIHRKLKSRHVQLIGIGGTIGVSLFTTISYGLVAGGPLSLLLAYVIWCIPILAITGTLAEMVCYLPIASPFVSMADRVVDEAFGVMVGWNFWILECTFIPFELVLFNSLIRFWGTGYSIGIPIAVQLVFYFFINVAAVKYYGETEFWLALGKVVLAVGLILFTFFTMVGANPDKDVYGFRNWKNPGPMVEYYSTGNLGRFQGFLHALLNAVFMMAGPEYVSMVAGETINPRKALPNAFKQVAYRLSIFFVGGALCVGIVVASNDEGLATAIADSKPGAGSSPYVIAMNNLKIKALPHIVNALLVTSSFSAGNSYTYCSSRTLYGLASSGKAPKCFSYCNKMGVPIYSVLVLCAWGLLAFLQLGETASTVLTWIIYLVSASMLMNFVCICITYVFFHRALRAQGVDRSTFVWVSWFQPYLAYVTGFVMFSFIWISGYEVFLPGNWSVETFLFNYFVVFLDVAIFIGWKLIKRTKLIAPEDADITTGLAEVARHEELLEEMEMKEKYVTTSIVLRVSRALFGE